MWQMPSPFMRRRFRREQTDFFAEPASESIMTGASLVSGTTMEFTILFLATALVMLIAWRGQRHWRSGCSEPS